MVDVAILGTGRMGAAMARRVAAAGHDLTMWNRTESSARTVLGSLPAGSARVAATAADAVAGRSVVLSMLADGAATREVLLDRSVLAALDSGAVVCDLATSGVATARALHSGLAQAAIGFVDAPVSGSVPAVNAGTLLVMASGAADAIAAVEPVLLAFARKVLRVGDAGAGQAMKLAVNLVVHVLNAAISEALILAERAGIPRDRAYDVLQDSVVAAPFVAYKRAAFLDPDTPVAMSLDLVLKDLRLITEFAAELAVGASVTEAVRAAVAAACAAGSGPQDMAALSRFATTRPAS
ncbi:MAG TPA: NAD(P)-dependent oxidoreductase [Kofleriaceae bacterium]|nr:NAD(P)-dependent oxidoreductase [Kofleriaceae bacterium]